MRFPAWTSFLARRRARLALATLLFGFAAWMGAPYLLDRVAPSAYVNAVLTRVTAPFNGQVAADIPAKGTFIARRTPIRLIHALFPGRIALAELRQERNGAVQEAALARRQIAQVSTAEKALAARIVAYRTAIIGQLGARVREDAAAASRCRAEARERHKILGSVSYLVRRGDLAPLLRFRARTKLDATAAHCHVLAARAARRRIQLAAARQGVFAGAAAGGQPPSQQQRDALLLRRQDLETAALRATQHAAVLEARIAAARHRIAETSNYRAALPADHVVWVIDASPGSSITQGEPILDLADCRTRFVVVRLPERDFGSIHIGDAAAIRLLGSDTWLHGRVRQVRGSAARSDDRLLAAREPQPGADAITVEVTLPPAVGSAADSCEIGRRAEVRFPRFALSLPRLWHTALAWLGAAPSAANRSRAPA